MSSRRRRSKQPTGDGDPAPRAGAGRRSSDQATHPSLRPPRRKRVVLADRRHTRQVARTIMELEEQTSVGEALVRHLVRVQLRAALFFAVLTVIVLCGLPVVFMVWPQVSGSVVFGIHLPWLILGVAPFPFLLLIGYLSTRTAERHERDFIDMVEH